MSEHAINEFCNLVKSKYSDLTLKELCQEASASGLDVSSAVMESWLKARGLRVRKKHSYDLRTVERICQYSEQNPSKTHNDLQLLCEQVFGHKVQQSVIATWLSRRQINLRKTRANKRPSISSSSPSSPSSNSSSPLSSLDERLLHYAPGFKRVRNCAGSDPQTLLLMLRFVYNSLKNGVIVSENDVRLYLEKVHGIIKRSEQISTLFRRYTLTHRLREVKLKRCSPEDFIRYIRESFPEIYEFDQSNYHHQHQQHSQPPPQQQLPQLNNQHKTTDYGCDNKPEGLTLELPLEVSLESDCSEPHTPDQIENGHPMAATPSSCISLSSSHSSFSSCSSSSSSSSSGPEIVGYPVQDNEMFPPYYLQQYPQLGHMASGAGYEEKRDYFGCQSLLPPLQTLPNSNLHNNSNANNNANINSNKYGMEHNAQSYLYSMPVQSLDYYSQQQPQPQQYQYPSYYGKL